MSSSRNEAQASPTISAEKMKGYDRDFDRIFSHPGACSIALTGSSAPDKRAVVEWWRKRKDPKRWMNVSIPHFNRVSPLNTSEAEDALINQIVCQMDLARSPKTRFRNLMKRNYALDVVIGVVFAAFVALTILLVWIAGLLPSSRPSSTLCILALIAWLACIGFGVFRIVRANPVGRILNRVRPKDDDIELSSGANDSHIERYMGDLVYLLNTNKYDYIVFEDLDTYRDLPLFERVRAMGTLANEQRKGKRTPLRFFYLVGDGLFDDPHERTEFFDCIVPVIPSVDSSSLLVQFRDGLAESGVFLNEEFLYELSGFVDDPGVLRDIVNETHRYKEELFGQTRGNPGDMERLVTLLTYKALFPRDFELLQNGRGYVAALLDSRPAVIDELRSRNERKARELADEQARAQDAGDAKRATGIQAELDALDREDLEYDRESLAELLAHMEDPHAVLESPPAGQNLDKSYSDAVLASPFFPFIRFAVCGGWIDGSYERFLSNFTAESLASSDRELITAIAQGESVDAKRVVSNPFSVVSHLDADRFSLPSARVYALLSHLLSYGPSNKLQSLLAGIGRDDSLEWIIGYTESTQFNGAVFGYMGQFLDRPIARVLCDESLDVSRRRQFCHRLLAFGQDALESEDTRSAVLEFAHADPPFLHVDCVKPLEIAKGLSAAGYRPNRLEIDGCDRELVQYVYDHDLYEPTANVADNLVAFLLETEPALPQGFLATRIYSLKGSAVRENVEADPGRFVSTLVEDTPVKLDDSAEAIAWVLNCGGLPPKDALDYLKALSDDVVIDRIGTIGNYTYQSVLLDRGLVESTPENILDYFISAGSIVDEHLAAFLEAGPFPASFTMATTEAHLGQESGFLKAVIECPELSDEKVNEIATTYRAQFNHFDIRGLSEERTVMLVQNGVIRTTADNLRFIRQNCPGVTKRFAQADTAAYLQLVLPGENGEPAECGFMRSEALAVFELEGVDDESKVALLGGFGEPVSLSRSYTNELNAAIAVRNFNIADLDRVDELYAVGNHKLKRALAEAVVAHREALAETGILLSMEMVTDIAWRLRESRADMVGFIAAQLAGRDPEPSRLEVRTMFERALLKEYIALIDGPSAIIPDTPEDDALLAVLSGLGMAGKQTGKTDWQGMRRVNSKGYSRK